MTDLQGKYQKLAAEYSKLRAQVPVLKKAVLDEQGKVEEYKETLKEKDQFIRKYEQEIESLTFRNKQLTTRVEVLQQELDGSPAPAKGKKSKNPVIVPIPNDDGTQGVIGEELQSKIEENARLHKQVYESDQEYRQQLMELQDQLAIYEREANQHQQVLSATMSSNKTLVDKLTDSKALLEIRLEKAEKEGRELKIRAEQSEEQLKNLQADLTSQLGEANKIISAKVPFNDTKIRGLNTLNVPTHDRQHQLVAKDLVGQATTLVKELIQGLSNWHTYCEQRSHIYPVDAETDQLSEVNKKLCHYLHENAAYLRPVDQAFRAFNDGLKEDSLTTLETATGLQEFACQLKRYTAYASKLLPYHLLSIEEECAVSSCTQTLEAKNLQVHAALNHFNSTFLKVENYVSILAHQSQPNCDHPRSSHTKLFQLLAKSLTDLHEATKELSKHYNAKVSLEHQLPTATVKLKTTDECIVSCLVSLVTCTSKISAFFESNLDFFNKASGYKTRGSSISQSDAVDGPRAHPCVSEFRQHAATYLATTTGLNTESVPYQVAVQNRKTLLSSTESRDSLTQQVANFHDKISSLEQEKEHWMLESQLIQMKYEKEQQKNALLAKQIEGDISGIESAVRTVNPLRAGRANTLSNIPLDVSMLGTVHSVVHPDEQIDPREHLIKNHYNSRIKKLTIQFQTADSKAVNFSAECRALHKRLTLSQQQNHSLQEQLTSSLQNVIQLKDELQTTTKSYEGQLSMMCEHLAGMNEKLTTQKDEIEVLKHQLQNTKSGKKGKVK